MAQDKDPSGSRKPDPQQYEPGWSRWLLWLVVSAVVIGVWFYIGQGRQANQTQTISYTAFKQQVKAGKVSAIVIEGQQVRGELKSHGQQQSATFATTLPPISDPNLMNLLEAHDVTITAQSQQESIWARLAIGIIPWILLIALFWWGSKKMRERMNSDGGGGGLFGMGKSRAKLPKGILLMGPPGTGKTLLSKAVAGEADVPFFSISGSEFVEMFVGVGASRVRDMFKQAKNESPSIIFIDEIDSIGRARGAGLGGGHDEREQTLNQILSEMDGFSPREAVIVMAATNRPDVLDPALMRPGRFDRKITFELPARAARLAILKTHGRKLPLADDVDFDGLAGRTVGMSGADLANLVNEAAMLAGRARHDQVHMSDFDNAYNRIVLGAQREDLVNEDEKRVIAYHESGHTLIAMLLKHTDPVNRVTIIPRGRALGATQQTPERDRYNLNESYLRDRMCVMLGGRGAERLMLGEVSTGAAEDLKQATQMARRMISHWGMNERIGPAAFIDEEDHVFLGRSMGQPRHFSEDTARVIDEETRKLMNSAERIVDELLEQHRATLERLAQALLERETLERDEVKAIVDARAPEAPRQHAEQA